MTLLEILTTVKQEARVTSIELDDWIKSVINEIYRDYCRNNEYSELLVTNLEIPITADEQSQFDFPVDARKIVAVEFMSTTALDSWRPLKLRNTYDLPFQVGYPNWYYIANQKVEVFPFRSITTDSKIRVTYRRLPTPLTADADEIVVDALNSVVKKETIARVVRYHSDTQKASDFVQDAQRSYIQGAE